MLFPSDVARILARTTEHARPNISLMQVKQAAVERFFAASLRLARRVSQGSAHNWSLGAASE
jgi:hypothetical protein